MLRVALIGAGMVSRHHLLAWQALPDLAQVIAIADPVTSQANLRAQEFNISGVFSDARTMLDCSAVDVVDIVSSRNTHADMVRLAADRGLAIMCQKPLAPSLGEAAQLIRDVGGSTPLMVHENWRFRPYYRRAAEWIRGGAIGQPRAVHMTLLSAGLIPDPDGKLPALERQPFMRTERRMLVNEVLIHHLDVLRFLVGPLTVVSARLRRHCPEILGEDSALIHLQTDGGALVTLLGSMAVAGHSASLIDSFEIAGDSGSIRFDDHVLQSAGKMSASVRYDPAQSYQAAYDQTIAHFVQALRTGAGFETGPEDNLQTLRLVEDIYALSAA